MTRRKSLRLPPGILDDITLAVAARRAAFSRAEMLALWLGLLEHAARAENPGSLATLDAETLALQLDLDSARITTGIKALRDKKRIDSQGRIVGWDRYQSTSTPRVRALRRRRLTTTPSAKKPSLKTVAPPVAADTPAAIAARRARLQQNNQLIIGPSGPQDRHA